MLCETRATRCVDEYFLLLKHSRGSCRNSAIVVGFLGMQAANEGRATNKGMSIAGIALGVLSIVLLIVSYATGLNERLLSGFDS